MHIFCLILFGYINRMSIKINTINITNNSLNISYDGPPKMYRCNGAQCTEDPTGTYSTSNCNNKCVAPVLDWTPAYFYSGGAVDGVPTVYTKETLGLTTPSGNLKRTGADPSCGTSDFATLSTCLLSIPLNANKHPPKIGPLLPDATRPSHNYPVQNLPWGKAPANILMEKNGVSSASDESNKVMCNNCPTLGEDCNAHVQLINPDNDGKVPVLAHGIFGVPLFDATCTPDAYTDSITSDLFKNRIKKAAAILGNGDYPQKPNSYITYYKAKNNNWVCLITKKAFEDAGVLDIYPSEANHDGVAIGWGHGVGYGACGSVSFLKQGEFNYGTDNTATKNNVVILFQTGMRAWSGEWNDSIGTQTPPFSSTENIFDATLNGSVQSYITEGLPYNSSSTTCLQPLMINIDSTTGGPIDKLLNIICPTLPLNEYGHNPCYIPQQNGICTCVDPTASICQPDTCKRADNTSIEQCTGFGAWGCGKWTPTAPSPSPSPSPTPPLVDNPCPHAPKSSPCTMNPLLPGSCNCCWVGDSGILPEGSVACTTPA
jgi:hypothetical protein